MTDDARGRAPQSSQSPRSRAAALGDLLDSSLEILGQIDALSQRQSSLIAGGDSEALLALVRDRGALTKRLQSVEAETKPLLNSWETVVAGIGEDAERALERRAASVAALARSISERDAGDCREIEAERDRAAAKLAGNRTSSAAAKAYGGTAAPRHQDREA